MNLGNKLVKCKCKTEAYINFGNLFLCICSNTALVQMVTNEETFLFFSCPTLSSSQAFLQYAEKFWGKCTLCKLI